MTAQLSPEEQQLAQCGLDLEQISQVNDLNALVMSGTKNTLEKAWTLSNDDKVNVIKVREGLDLDGIVRGDTGLYRVRIYRDSETGVTCFGCQCLGALYRPHTPCSHVKALGWARIEQLVDLSLRNKFGPDFDK